MVSRYIQIFIRLTDMQTRESHNPFFYYAYDVIGGHAAA
jgi:hypothetical protein